MIECICINDKNRPTEIPVENWPKEGEKYHITHIHLMVIQNSIQGCELKELSVPPESFPYMCYRLSRFAIREEDIESLIELAEACSGLEDLPEEFIKELEKEIVT